MSLSSSDIARVWTSAQHELEIQKSLRQFNTLRKHIKRKHKYMEENMVKFGKKVKSSTNHTIEKLIDSLRDFTYHSMKMTEICRKLNTNMERGLTEQEASMRLQEGQNQVEGIAPPSKLSIYLNQVSDPFNLLLWALSFLAIVAYLALNDSNQLLLAIILWITINSGGILGFYYEKKSYKDVDTMQRLIPQFTTVIRDGAHQTVMVRKVVKGDIVVLKPGQKCPADVRIFQSNGVKVNRASFTGESEHISCSINPSIEYNPLDSPNMIFSGTMIEDGEGKGIVVNIGEDMLISEIKDVIANVQTKESYMKQEIAKFVKWLTIFSLGIGLFTFFGGWGVGFPAIIAADIAIGVMVASCPGILNLEITCILAFSMTSLAKKNIVCKRLVAVESLGATQILCTDKTGTLTTNRMTMENMFFNRKYFKATNQQTQKDHNYDTEDETFRYLMKCAVLSSVSKFDLSVPKEDLSKIRSRTDLLDSQKEIKQQQVERNWRKKYPTIKIGDRPIIGDSTESALIRFFQPIHDIEHLRHLYPIVRSRKQNRQIRSPFSSLQKYSYSIHREESDGGFYTLYLKGAPERVWNICRYIMEEGKQVHKKQEHTAEFNEVLQGWGKQGKRVLAFAMLKLPSKRFHQNFDFSIQNRNYSLNGLTFLGMVSLQDPPRKGVPETIRTLKRAGIKVIMVTGDQEVTAIQIGRQCNLIDHEKTSTQLMKQNGMSFSEAFSRCKNIVINGDQLTEMMGDEEIQLKRFKGNNFRRILEKEGIIFARTTPAQKLYITEMFQSLGYYVTVTGDGVNDSPAIKVANTGVAMNCGSDAAKDSADITLANDDFNSMCIGIQEGRRQFDNFKRAICYVMTSQVSQWMPFVFLITTRIPIPIFTLLVDGVVDFIPTLAFAFEESESGIMTRRPRHSSDPLINFALINQCQGWMGFSSFLCCLLAYYIVMIDYGYVPNLLWNHSNSFILLEDQTDHFNPSDPKFGNSNLHKIESCAQFDKMKVRVDWINSLYPATDLRMTAVTCYQHSDGRVSFHQYMTFDRCRVQQISYYTSRPICYTPEATKYGQTSYMMANVVNQFFNWFICRTRYDSTITKRFNNTIYVMAIGAEMMLAVALIYTKFMNKLISTRDIIFEHWGLCAIPYAIIQLCMDELRKYLMRTLPPNKAGRPNWFIRHTLW